MHNKLPDGMDSVSYWVTGLGYTCYYVVPRALLDELVAKDPCLSETDLKVALSDRGLSAYTVPINPV